MPFNIMDLPHRRSTQVVALLLVGMGNGTEQIRGPVLIHVTRQDGHLNVVSRLADGSYFEIPGADYDKLAADTQPTIHYGWRETESPNWLEGTGKVYRVAILGTVGLMSAVPPAFRNGL